MSQLFYPYLFKTRKGQRPRQILDNADEEADRRAAPDLRPRDQGPQQPGKGLVRTEDKNMGSNLDRGIKWLEKN